MKGLLRISAGVCVASLAFLLTAPAQNRMNFSLVSQDSGHIALGLALRKLDVSGTFMQAPAHPDDETNALFALFTYGMGLRSIDLQNNRGDGGQNEIGPELFRDIAVLRTSELLAAHRIDGAEQYFTRAIDYGYSFDPQEVISKWGRKEIVGDYVRLIRELRPDVIVTMNIQGRGGDRAHEATTILVQEAWHQAGDPSMYPEQLQAGLRPWQPRKLYFSAPQPPPGEGRGGQGRGERGAAASADPPAAPASNVRLTRVNTVAYDPLLGRTYAEIGNDARSSHKCQGMTGVPPLPGAPAGRGGFGGGPPGYQLMASSIPGQMEKQETSLFDGIDTSLTGLAQFAGPNPPAALTAGIAEIMKQAKLARIAYDGNDAGTAAPAEAGLTAVRALRAQLTALPLSDSARYEIDYRLALKERDYENAVLIANGLTFDAVADDGLVVAGQPVKLSLVAVNRGAADARITQVEISGFDPQATCAPEVSKSGVMKRNASFTCNVEAHVPMDAKPTTPYFTDNYWKHPENQAIQIFDPSVPFGVPFAATPFRAVFHVKAGDMEIRRDVPVQFRYVKDIYTGDKRMELSVVPALSVRVAPALAVFPAAVASKPVRREVRVAVTNGTKAAVQASVALDLPAGWKAIPASMPMSFAHEDESLSARFEVTEPAQVKPGDYTLRAVVTSPAFADRKFTTGYQDIEYPHVERRQVIKPAEIPLKVIDVKTAPGVSVGYIDGVGDQVPPAIEQLGAKLTFIDADELSGGDLSKYDVIVTGVRAYERRADLRAYNHRLLDYASRGGTVIVQYNKTEFNQEQYGPYPVKVGNDRVSDESVPVKILAPADPVFNLPNKLGPEVWAGWTQERGLYFLGEKDPKYIDLVSMVDSFKDNPGVKLGSFVEARTGKGRWIYLGLGLWRQLPAGTSGAYELLANLIALGHR
jgi:hypothetical protein